MIKIIFIFCFIILFCFPVLNLHAKIPSADKSCQNIKSFSDKDILKISPELREKIKTHSDSSVIVCVLINGEQAPTNYFSKYAISRKIGKLQWITGQTSSNNLLKIASLTNVASIISSETYQPYQTLPLPISDDNNNSFDNLLLSLKNIKDKKIIQNKIDEIVSKNKMPPSNKNKKIKSNVVSKDSIKSQQVKNIHNVADVWKRGFYGKNIITAIVDTGVDFAHPDLDGTQARAKNGPFKGYPFSYDTLSAIHYIFDEKFTIGPDTYWRKKDETWFCHTLPVENLLSDGNICTATLKVDYGTDAGWGWEPVYLTYTWRDTSKSKKYYYTVHPDFNLLFTAYIFSIGYTSANIFEPPIVIISDENIPNVYDTVYVDCDFDQTLLDEKPMRMGDETAGADIFDAEDKINPDGVIDLSAGMLSWISDGINSPPGLDVVYPNQAKIPENGRLIVFTGDSWGHGTSCAGNVAAQGIIDDPYGLGSSNIMFAGGKNIGGVGGPVLTGMAPGAEIASFQNGYNFPYDAFILASLGFDGIANTGDEANIISNSWGDSEIIPDGWDYLSRFVGYINDQIAPHTIFLFAVGNGGHGYGTVTSPTFPTAIDVGASTSYGSLNIIEYVTPSQFTYGDVIFWSNRGPSCTGDIAPDILAVGSFGSAPRPINLSRTNGLACYSLFSGTSMSCPVAAGVCSLIYQAFFETHSRLPYWHEVKSILLNGADDIGYDVLVQGSGNINAFRSMEIAIGENFYAEPSQWSVDRMDNKYLGFISAAFPGDIISKTVTIFNPTDKDININIADGELTKIHETFFDIYITTQTQYIYTIPSYLRDITKDIDALNPDMVRATAVCPFGTFDLKQDYFYDTQWMILFYDWTDNNKNGHLWQDLNENGLVDFNEIDIDPKTNIYEFNRFNSGYPAGTIIETSVGQYSLSRKHNGVFLGLQRLIGSAETNFKIKISYYKKSDWNWLATDKNFVSIPPNSNVNLQAIMKIHKDASYGLYEGGIYLEGFGSERVIPIVVNVAAESDTFKFGVRNLDEESATTPYDNSHLHGGFNWAWRYDAGDWKMFSFEMNEEEFRSTAKAIIVKTSWKSVPTDIDTWILSPYRDLYSMEYPNLFGPYSMVLSGGSKNTYMNSGIFLFNTSSETSQEIVSGKITRGMNTILLHNVLNAGIDINEAFGGECFGIESFPYPVYQFSDAGSWIQSFKSKADIPEGIVVSAYGLSEPAVFKKQPVTQDNQYDLCSAKWYKSIEIKDCGLLEITTSGTTNMDIDLYLFKDRGDGVFRCDAGLLLGSSTAEGANESLIITKPKDGKYWVVVYGFRVPLCNAFFDITIDAISGTNLVPSDFLIENIKSNQAVQFKISYNKTETGTKKGIIFIGTKHAPESLQIPVYIIDSQSTVWVNY